jgi:hypothetical protein
VESALHAETLASAAMAASAARTVTVVRRRQAGISQSSTRFVNDFLALCR